MVIRYYRLATTAIVSPEGTYLLAGLAAALDEEGAGAAAVAAAVRDANKRTALHFAAREGRTDVCQFLIDQLGLPVDPKDEDGNASFASFCTLMQTPPCMAVSVCMPSHLYTALSSLGETPLVHAARQGHLDTANYLLDHGADPSVASCLGATALHHAAGIGSMHPPRAAFFFSFHNTNQSLAEPCIFSLSRKHGAHEASYIQGG